jgi:fumarate hydratase subunit beta
MDAYAPELIRLGLKGMIGKGARNQQVKDAMAEFKAAYFAAIGGAGALMAQAIKKAEIVAYEDLGPEAIRRLEVEEFPVIVVNDVRGNDLYEEGVKQYAITR